MTSIPRLALEEAARHWLDDLDGHGSAVGQIAGALTDFVDRRYRGAAADLRRVHALRLRLLGDERPLQSMSEAPPGSGDGQTLGEAASASAPPDQGRLLFHLVRAFSPGTVLEMGTNLGISAAYIGLGLRYSGGDRLITIEGSPVRMDLARGILEDLGIEGVDLVRGYFDEVLPSLLDDLGQVDLAFVDGNHQLQPTLSYFEQLRSHMPPGGLLVLDDIRWSVDMMEAWNRIVTSSGVATTVDLGRTGLVVLA